MLHDVATSADVKRVILTSGKVYYDLKQARDKASANVAILRLEQFYPFPQPMLADALKRLPERDGDRLGAGRAAQHGRLAVPARAPRGAARREPEAARTSDARWPRRRRRARITGTRSSRRRWSKRRWATIWSAAAICCPLCPLWYATQVSSGTPQSGSCGCSDSRDLELHQSAGSIRTISEIHRQ